MAKLSATRTGGERGLVGRLTSGEPAHKACRRVGGQLIIPGETMKDLQQELEVAYQIRDLRIREIEVARIEREIRQQQEQSSDKQ